MCFSYFTCSPGVDFVQRNFSSSHLCLRIMNINKARKSDIPDLFDKDEFPDDESSTTESSVISLDDEDAPKPFLINYSAKRLLSERTEEANVGIESTLSDSIQFDRNHSLTSDEVLKEVRILLSHRRMLSITTQDQLSTQDPQEDGLVVDEVQPDLLNAEKVPEKSDQSDEKDENAMDDPMSVVRSYVNISPSHRNVDRSIFRPRKNKVPDEARVQAMMLMNIFVNRHEQNANRFPRNIFITSKYTVWNFLFINLFEQFSRIANFVFLLVTLVQLVPGVSPFNIWATILPLLFILCVSALKEGYEDYCRHKTDEITNSIQYRRVEPDGVL